MSLVSVTESSLENIAAAIRNKKGGTDTYTPGQMAGAINGIHTADEVVLVQKNITANGTYNPEGDSANGYSSVSVDVANSYTSADNGKVVSNQQLVAQTSRNISQNGTYDTTENNEIVVDVQGGGGSTLIAKSITQNGTYNPADDNADGYSQVTVNVSGGGGGGDSDAFAEYDFTKLYGTIRGVQYGTSGAVFSTQYNCIHISTPKTNDITIEVDIASMQLTSGTHRRLLMNSYNNGFIYRSSGVWGFYQDNWYNSDISDPSYLDNALLSAYIDTTNHWHFYRNGVLFFEPSGYLSISTNNDYYGRILLGSYDGNAINNATIRGLKIYDGLHIQ